MYNPSDIDNIYYGLIVSFSKLLCKREDLTVTSTVSRHISCTLPLLYICQTLCKGLSLLSVLVSIIILHVSYELFRWFCIIFRLKVCAVDCMY